MLMPPRPFGDPGAGGAAAKVQPAVAEKRPAGEGEPRAAVAEPLLEEGAQRPGPLVGGGV
jgi:hypothetical protein